MRNSNRLLEVLLAASLAAGCASTSSPPRGTQPAPPTGSGAGYDFRKEGRIPPPSTAESRAESDVEEIAVSDSAIDVTEAEAPPRTTPPPVAAIPDSTTEGFRIQLFASADREVAEGARVAAFERLGVPAYLDLDNGVYKVRVGDYVTRPDAERALATARSHYYPDAWIVAARVRVPRRTGP